ncbi:hypothetical protein MD484_g3893, partial [Candolleomyces efflorescens]
MNSDNQTSKPLDNFSLASGQHNRIGLCFDQLRGEIDSIMVRESTYRDRIFQLEKDLEVYKRAYAGLQFESAQLQTRKQEIEKQNEELASRVKANRVVVLVDGDGAIFDDKLIEKGQAGGHAAASRLSSSVNQHILLTEGGTDHQLWAHVFLNRRGLADALGRAGLLGAKHKLEDFMIGFNQATERFTMVDVGSAKEAADAKIKSLLESEIKMPQTAKIVFGGSHDNGYVTTLRSHITAGFKHKLILLPSYTEVATGISELELPLLDIPDLFMREKLNVANSSNMSIYPVSGKSGTASSVGSTDEAIAPHPGPLNPPSYSTIAMLRAAPRASTSTSDLDSGLSSASSNETDDALSRAPTVAGPPKLSRRINPHLPLSKQKPPPCTLFYLANCKHGAGCRYGHNYLLLPEHYDEIRENARKAPCPAANQGEVCTWGKDCCYGHKCPQTTKCYFLKLGKCKFQGPSGDMHRD